MTEEQFNAAIDAFWSEPLRAPQIGYCSITVSRSLTKIWGAWKLWIETKGRRGDKPPRELIA